MPNIAICEDDLATSRYIEGLVRAYQKQRPGQIDQVAVFLSSAQLLEQVAKDKNQFDIYLLDVLMPGASGIETARRLQAQGCEGTFVFLTASKDFALDAFRVGALQYLVKPVRAQDLYPVLDRALGLLSRQAPKSILVSTVRGKENLAFSSIVYVECRNHILTYHLADGTALLGRTIRTSFEVAMEPLLREPNFIHPHKSFILNADHVDRLTSQAFIMTGGAQVPITKSRYSQARSRYLQYFDLTTGL